MPLVHIDARVRLKEDVLTCSIPCGAEGVVVSVWLSPGDFQYEVEFRGYTRAPTVRLLLRAEQLEVVE